MNRPQMANRLVKLARLLIADDYDQDAIDLIAQAAHEANRAFCMSHGDDSQVPWESAPEEIKESARRGVLGVLRGNGPEESHQGWMQTKTEQGWVHGPKKDMEKKTHPAMVPYEELPPEQKAKDKIFVDVVHSMAAAMGLPVNGQGTP